MNVSSEIGQGTEFVICLPAAEGATASPQEAVDAVLSGTAMSGRVLIMDDEEMILDVASMMLFELGCDVDTCKSGSEAVERYQSVLESGGAYDAVILDLTVPGGMGGLEAARVIRALDPHATLIVSSGYSHDAILADFREHDFSGAVMKPYSMDALNEELIRVMGQGRFGNKDQ